MLQIIGWMLCAMLAIKGISMMGDNRYIEEDAEGNKKMSEAGHFAAIASIIVAVGFAFWFFNQGEAFADLSRSGYSSPLSPEEERQLEEDARRDAGL